MIIRLSAIAALLAASVFCQTYTTNFPNTENPISEGGTWTNGGAVGIDWQDVQTANGRAYSTNVCTGYNDCIAVLSGFPADHSAQATIYLAPGYTAPSSHEVELLLRFRITARSARGYEVLHAFAGGGLQIVRWNGPLGDFTMLPSSGTGLAGLATGDVIKAQMVGNTITVYKNGVQIQTCTDNTFTDGNPGMDFFVRPGGTLANYCITSYTATGIGGTQTVATPVISPNGGYFTDSVQVTLSCATSGSEIRYTTNGSTPTASSALYSAPFTLTGTATVKAIGLKSGMTNSAVASADFTEGVPPAFSKKINFQPASTAIPSGYVMDDGSAYSSSRGYGWAGAQGEARERNVNPDKRLDTFIKTYSASNWMLDVPSPGQYVITVAMGDPTYATLDTLKFGTQTLIAASNGADEYTVLTDTLNVTAPQLVLSVLGAICYIDVAVLEGSMRCGSRIVSPADGLALSSACPNPFNAFTRLAYTVPFKGPVTLKIFDMLGREVAVPVNGTSDAGDQTVHFNGSAFPAGVYIARLAAGGLVRERAVVIAR